ncbi:hypothetical protein [Nocardioides sp. TF02-7]|uniref:hypothetical protein n=1 Tax=Nocardioides sp. TF02-7 TaxID=2917724 RepID=UPI001F05E4A6|nr:hypothetical protein [Nocardioides sp. TF02-7]UMG93256.1 hypothetical protein MF408_02895 [Nocardioides sp. TF02-7]
MRTARHRSVRFHSVVAAPPLAAVSRHRLGAWPSFQVRPFATRRIRRPGVARTTTSSLVSPVISTLTLPRAVPHVVRG